MAPTQLFVNYDFIFSLSILPHIYIYIYNTIHDPHPIFRPLLESSIEFAYFFNFFHEKSSLRLPTNDELRIPAPYNRSTESLGPDIRLFSTAPSSKSASMASSAASMRLDAQLNKRTATDSKPIWISEVRLQFSKCENTPARLIDFLNSEVRLQSQNKNFKKRQKLSKSVKEFQW